MPRIFISYRRVDKGFAGRLYDYLRTKYDERELFLDVASIAGGEDFPVSIDQAIGSCQVLIAIITPRWLDLRDDRGRRRLDMPKDLVRREIASALKLGLRVVPALFDGARMPHPNDLPDELQALHNKNAVEISYERFAYDAERLVQAIGGSFGKVIVIMGSPSMMYQGYRIRSLWSGNYKASYLVQIDGVSVGILGYEKADQYTYYNDDKYLTSISKNVREGEHSITVRGRGFYDRLPSSSLRFKLKGGQTRRFIFEQKGDSAKDSYLILKPYKPVIDE